MARSILLLISCAGMMLGISLGFRQALGLFLTPITVEVGVGRESFALGMGLMNLVWGLGAPFAGALTDRYGAGWVTVAGALLYATGLAVLTISGDGGQLIAGGVLVGLGLSGTGFTVVLGTVGRIVPEAQRSAALGLVAAGGSIGQFMSLPYTYSLIAGFGWSLALLALAASALLMAPLAYGLREKPAPAMDGPRQAMGAAFREALGVPSYWLLNAGFFVCGFHLAFIGVHLPAFLQDEGFGPGLATVALSVVGLANIAGSYGFGVLGGYYSKKNLLSLLYLGRAAVIMMFITLPITDVTVLLFSGAMGFLWLGTVPLTSGLVAEMFGTRYMAMLFGIVFLGHQFGGFLGAWLGGVAFDTFGSYDAMWWISIALGIVSALLHWPIAERRAGMVAAR
ncbi:MAG: MFS transporter [Hyphomicrobiaceae bacterium]|nr:MFS transporter [Hyphomicrobiaceae bacterium]